MKRLLLPLVLCVLANPTNGQNKSDREAAGLAGRVQTVRTETVKLWKDNSGDYKELYTYGVKTITYDEQGKIIKEDPREPGCGYFDNLRRETKTDSDGRVIEGTAFLPNGRLFRRTTYAYDSTGYQTEVASYDHRNLLEFKWTRVYDLRGRVLEATRYDRNGTHQGHLDHREVYVYDDKGNETDFMCYDPAGRLDYWSSQTYEYDTNGNWIQRLFYKKVVDGKELPFEPSEATNRNIAYY
jgi:hypothetical protein